MRDIKFRAYSKTHKKMFFDDTFKTALNGMINLAKNHLGRCDIKSGIYLPLEDKDLIFMQYTGLQDENGREIYEGDYAMYMLGGVAYTRIVVFENGAFYIDWEKKAQYHRAELSYWHKKIFIDGNIFTTRSC